MVIAAYRPYTAGATARNRALGAPRALHPAMVVPEPGGDAPPTPPVAGGGGGGGAGGGHGGSPPAAASSDPYSSDPIYQQIVALANTNVQQAQASATAARKQVAIELGDPGLAKSLGLGNLTEQTAQANPFSSLKNLLRTHNANVEQTNDSRNKANLYSSSSRERGLQLEQTGYQGGIAGAAQSAQHALTTILANLLAAQQAAAAQKAQAAADAYGRVKAEPPVPGLPPITTDPSGNPGVTPLPEPGGRKPGRKPRRH